MSIEKEGYSPAYYSTQMSQYTFRHFRTQPVKQFVKIYASVCAIELAPAKGTFSSQEAEYINRNRHSPSVCSLPGTTYETHKWSPLFAQPSGRHPLSFSNTGGLPPTKKHPLPGPAMSGEYGSVNLHRLSKRRAIKRNY